MGRILLGVSGSVAAYKAVEFARLAIKAGHSVRVLQTEAAARFVGPATFSSVTGSPVLISQWERDPARGAFAGQRPHEHDPLAHLELVANADVFLIAPASANTIAKLAHGFADNALTAAALAAREPLIVAPAMNAAMYEHPASRANLAILKARGAEVLDPGTGPLGSLGEWGIGRLPEPPELLAACERRMARHHVAHGGDLDGLRVLVSAGGTREPIDAVRFIGNRSSGRMGYALAERASQRGAQVTVIAANVALARDNAIAYVDVETAGQLAAACVEHFEAADVLLMAAAVADFRPAAAASGKLKKDSPDAPTALALERTQDVLASLSAVRRPGQTLIGFAAEHGPRAVANGREKLERKDLDAVVVNDISDDSIGFDSTDNEVTLVTRDGERTIARTLKAEVAEAILDLVLSLRSGTATRVAG